MVFDRVRMCACAGIGRPLCHYTRGRFSWDEWAVCGWVLEWAFAAGRVMLNLSLRIAGVVKQYYIGELTYRGGLKKKSLWVN